MKCKAHKKTEMAKMILPTGWGGETVLQICPVCTQEQNAAEIAAKISSLGSGDRIYGFDLPTAT
jgi:hypothetical protein